MLAKPHFEQAKSAAKALNIAAKPLRLLGSVAWDDDWRDRFLNQHILPAPTYPTIDVTNSLNIIARVRGQIAGDHVVFEWLRRLSDSLETTAHLIRARGTAEFFIHSKTLFGEPSALMLDQKTRVIDLARHLDDTLEGLDAHKLMIDAAEPHMSASDFADALRPHLVTHFGKRAPKVIIAQTLSAKAVAGSRRIRLRASATFSARDIDQLLQHEALVHAATGLNGRQQSHFPVLGRPHAGTTEIQEGLAVFAEMISGAMDPARFRRLSDRVMAIQSAIDGADFNEVFDFYKDRIDDPAQAYENTRRVFRGGLITGGAPFTKDMVYLNGLLRVHNFMRSAVTLGRADLIRILFSGKMDLEDIPALAQMAHSGRLNPPEFMPHWVKDMRFLVSYMAYSSFLNQVKLPGLKDYYADALSDVPRVWDFV